MINIKKDKSLLEILFMIFFIFGTKALFIPAFIFLGIFIYKEYYKEKKKNLIDIFNTLKTAVFYKFLLSILYPYGNIDDESFRMLILIYIIDSVYKFKIKKFKISYFSYGVLSLFTLGIIWNYFSFGGIESVQEYIYRNINLLLPVLLLDVYYSEKKYIKITKYIIPLTGLGIFIRYFENMDTVYILKGGMISLFSVILPFTLFFIFDLKNKKWKIFYSIIAILDIALIIKLGARAGLFGTLITVILILLISQNLKRILLFIVIVLIFLFGMTRIPNIENHFFRYRDFSTRSREYLIRAGVYCFEKNPVFGVGSGNTQKYFIEYSETKFLEENKLKNESEINTVKNHYLRYFPDTHNIIVDFMAQNGIYGILFSVLLCMALPLYIMYIYLKTRKTKYLKYLGSILGFLVTGQSWSLWTKHNIGVIYLIIIIIMFWRENTYEKEHSF